MSERKKEDKEKLFKKPEDRNLGLIMESQKNVKRDEGTVIRHEIKEDWTVRAKNITKMILWVVIIVAIILFVYNLDAVIAMIQQLFESIAEAFENMFTPPT